MKQDWSCLEAKWQILRIHYAIQSTCQYLEFSRKLKKENVVSYFQFLLNCGIVLRLQLKYSLNIFHVTHHIYLYGQLMCCLISSPLSTILYSPLLGSLPGPALIPAKWCWMITSCRSYMDGKKLFGFLSLQVTDQKLQSVFYHGYSRLLCCA